MKTLGSIAGFFGVTGAFLTLLLWAKPFDRTTHALHETFAAAPSWTQVSNLVTDRNTQELTGGEHPLESFEILEKSWSGPGDSRVLFMGNSQMMNISLAPGEPEPTSPEKTWVDLMADRGLRGYRLAAPAMSYAEALWYLQYFLSHPGLMPDVVVLQLNYQSFWNAGVRTGMLEMLSDDAFRSRIEKEVATDAGYAETFGSALENWKELQESAIAAAAKPQSEISLAAFGENAIRSQLEGVLKTAAQQRSSFFDMLYTMRVYLLRISPTTARSITGTRLNYSRAAVAAIVDLCFREQVRLILFNAPVNPRVNLYRRREDREDYLAYLESLERENHAVVYDFESSIPAEEWGAWLNGPDPLHMGRAAHTKLANLVGQAIEKELAD